MSPIVEQDNLPPFLRVPSAFHDSHEEVVVATFIARGSMTFYGIFPCLNFATRTTTTSIPYNLFITCCRNLFVTRAEQKRHHPFNGISWCVAQVKDILVDTNILIENVKVVIYSSQEKNSHQRNPFLEEDSHSSAVCKVLRFAVILTSLAFMTLGN